MNTPFVKNSSSKVLALWFIGAAMVLVAVISPADEAATRTTPVGVSAELQGLMIPSLYPQKLIALDLVDHLFKIQMRELQIENAARHMGDIEYFVAQEVNIPKDDVPPKPITEEDFYPIITAAAKQHEVDPSIVKAIILAESSYNPNAVSNKGAKGLMQLMPVTARELGVKNSFDPEQNIYGGVKYFKMLLNRYKGNVKLALAAYNAGSGKVQKYKGIPRFKATRLYINKVLKYQKYYTRQAKSSTRVAADSSKS